MTRRFGYRSAGCCFSLMPCCHFEHVCCNEALKSVVISCPAHVKRVLQTMLEGTITLQSLKPYSQHVGCLMNSILLSPFIIFSLVSFKSRRTSKAVTRESPVPTTSYIVTKLWSVLVSMDSFCQLSRKLSPESLSFQYPELVLPEGLGRVGGGGRGRPPPFFGVCIPPQAAHLKNKVTQSLVAPWILQAKSCIYPTNTSIVCGKCALRSCFFLASKPRAR